MWIIGAILYLAFNLIDWSMSWFSDKYSDSDDPIDQGFSPTSLLHLLGGFQRRRAIDLLFGWGEFDHRKLQQKKSYTDTCWRNIVLHSCFVCFWWRRWNTHGHLNSISPYIFKYGIQTLFHIRIKKKNIIIFIHSFIHSVQQYVHTNTKTHCIWVKGVNLWNTCREHENITLSRSITGYYRGIGYKIDMDRNL